MDIRSTIRLRSGNDMPVLGLGTWQLTHDTAETVGYALNLGYHMIDTSGDYGTQPGIGEAIKLVNEPRDNVYIVTKVEETDDAYEAVVRNLAELQMDYADLVLIHRPPLQGVGEELWKGLQRAKDEGLTRDIGVSNYSMELLEKFMNATGDVPAVNQIEWSPFGHSTDMLNFARQHEMVVQAYSPLTRARRLDDLLLKDIAATYGKTPAQVILRWGIQMGVVPLPKANNQFHLQENIAIFDFTLNDEDMDRISGLNEQYSSLGGLQYI